ncbi:hypothetical protein [Sphingobium sp.]|uniref:hypothetical protein n=1 Tax=Sphingobium sp. TaxID=1912891 RepID=UPI0028BD9586|nr:hypothetical protein [Sphingobium sp.]
MTFDSPWKIADGQIFHGPIPAINPLFSLTGSTENAFDNGSQGQAPAAIPCNASAWLRA